MKIVVSPYYDATNSLVLGSQYLINVTGDTGKVQTTFYSSFFNINRGLSPFIADVIFAPVKHHPALGTIIQFYCFTSKAYWKQSGVRTCTLSFALKSDSRMMNLKHMSYILAGC